MCQVRKLCVFLSACMAFVLFSCVEAHAATCRNAECARHPKTEAAARQGNSRKSQH